MAETNLSIYLLLAGGGFFFNGFRLFSRQRLIRDTPTSKVRAIAMGIVELSGKAAAAQTMLKSPVSKKDCMYSKFTVEEYQSSGKTSRWAMLKKGETAENFYFEDETGKVLVNPNGAEIQIPIDHEYPGFQKIDGAKYMKSNKTSASPVKDFDKASLQFLKNQNINPKGLLGFDRRIRIREYYIAPGDPLYMIGTAIENPNAKSRSKNEDSIIIAKGKNHKEFFIADKPEKEVVKQMGLAASLQLYGGAALLLLGLFFLLAELGLFWQQDL